MNSREAMAPSSVIPLLTVALIIDAWKLLKLLLMFENINPVHRLPA